VKCLNLADKIRDESDAYQQDITDSASGSTTKADKDIYDQDRNLYQECR